MKCPNCRCTVPGSMYYCSYCGYRFDDGSAYTIPVTEAYNDRLYTQSEYYYSYSQELSGTGYSDNYYYHEPQLSLIDMYFSFETFVSIILGLCSVFLLMILALLVMLL